MSIKVFPLVKVAILALVLLAPLGPLAGEGTCDAIVDLHLSRQDQEDGQTTLVFAVEVDVHENDCSKVGYDVVVETSDAAGKTHRAPLARATKVTDREKSQKVNYKMPRGHSLVKYEIENVTCYECGNEP